MIYLFVFCISTVFTYLAQKSVVQKSMFYFFSAIAILLPSLLAGFRDSGIGTDTTIYVDDVWEKISYCNNLSSFFISYAVRSFDDMELLYLLINYFVYHWGGELHTLYFILNFIVVFFFYKTAYDNRNRASMWLVMALFFLIYYNISLNLIRQSIALSMSVYAFKYMERKQWKKMALWFFLIMAMHNTGIFYIIFFVFYRLHDLQSKKIRNFFLLLLYGAITLFLIAFDTVLSLIVSMNILPEKFLLYASNESESAIPKSSLLFSLMILSFLCLINRFDKRIKQNNELRFYTASKFIGSFLFLTSLVSKWAFRISYYFSCISDCVFLPRSLYIYKKRHPDRYFVIITFLLLVCLVMWFWIIVYRNENQTYPYKSHILGIY